MAAKGVESELKYQVSRADYRKLVRLLGRGIPVVRTTTTYFDDDSLTLKRAGVGLRLRDPGRGKLTLTVKAPVPGRRRGPRALSVRRELEARCDRRTVKPILEGRKPMQDLRAAPLALARQHVSDFDTLGIRALGQMKLSRVKTPMGQGFIVEIDHFKIYGEDHFEVELETDRPRAGDKLVRTFFKKHRIRYRPLTKSKLARFLGLWKKQKKRR